jgi:SAM-dependent methyltransferase
VAKQFDMALEILQLDGTETILDLGAGRGWAAKALAQKGCRVVAVDVVADDIIGLGRARALMDNAHVYFDRLIADGENLPFLTEKFDVVFCAAALHHCSDLVSVLQNVSRVLKSDGYLCAINEPCISIIEDEQAALQRDAEAELALGINETRPDLLEYAMALQKAQLEITAVFPPSSHNLSEQNLDQWGRELGVFWPDYRFRWQQLVRLGYRFCQSRLLAWRNGRYHPAQQLIQKAPSKRAQIERSFLIWRTGSLILLAKK